MQLNTSVLQYLRIYTVLYVGIQYILYCMSVYSIYCTVCRYTYLKRPEWLGMSDIEVVYRVRQSDKTVRKEDKAPTPSPTFNSQFCCPSSELRQHTSCPLTASNEKEMVRNEADTPTSPSGKDTGIGRRNHPNYSSSTLENFTGP